MEPRALLSKEVKSLKNSKMNKFTNTLEINLDLAANAQMKAIEAIEQNHKNLGYWCLQNASDFIRNNHTLPNLERLKIRDPSSANAVKNYVDGAELISPQMKSIIDSQKKLMPKYYQNSFYRRRISYSYGSSNYSNQMASQITSQLAKTFIALSTSFFPEGGKDPFQASKETIAVEEEVVHLVETKSTKIRPGGTEGRGGGCSQGGPIKNIFSAAAHFKNKIFNKKKNDANIYRQTPSKKILEKKYSVQKISKE
jgi:hypothetical protein